MSNNQPSDIFVERISNVSHANGVFRITLGVNDSPNDIRPVTCLMVPANQLGPMLQGIANAAKNIGEQIQLTGDGDPAPKQKAQAKPATKKKTAPKKSPRTKK
ncbi:MAG: hypothetical protein CMF67_13625 [Magnetovibrio sp.]|nr:hypothetical protein [Magnetovibrio sp.]|tara:strand:- start:2987 stop:3295 length:309 start_codon:yes stop_codon:yes gene_type:complete